MKAPTFIAGTLATAIVFLASAYWLSGSFWYSVAATLVVLVVVQVGYFCYVLIMSAQEHRRRSSAEQPEPQVGERGIKES